MKDEDDAIEFGTLLNKPGIGLMMMHQLQQFNAEQDSFHINFAYSTRFPPSISLLTTSLACQDAKMSCGFPAHFHRKFARPRPEKSHRIST